MRSSRDLVQYEGDMHSIRFVKISSDKSGLLSSFRFSIILKYDIIQLEIILDFFSSIPNLYATLNFNIAENNFAILSELFLVNLLEQIEFNRVAAPPIVNL